MEKFLIIIVYRFWLGHKIKNRIFYSVFVLKVSLIKSFQDYRKVKKNYFRNMEKFLIITLYHFLGMT